MEAGNKVLTKNMERVARGLFSTVEEARLFLDAFTFRGGTQTAVAWLREKPLEAPFKKLDLRPTWLPDWIEVAAVGERPGKLSAHNEGNLYCLDLSSTFACAAYAEVEHKAPIVVDVCAAPGGKGILAYRYLQPSLTIANEVIRKRTAQLISNYKRCQIDPAFVVSYDPKNLAETCGALADVVIVDAPCSGQSLVIKDKSAPGAFHPATISMNERRQRRILAHSQALTRGGGYLLYSTCTFSREENEDTMAWFLKSFPDFHAVEVRSLQAFRSHLSEYPSYRLWPQQGFGAGSFSCLLQRRRDLREPGAISVAPDLWRLWRSTSFASASDIEKGGAIPTLSASDGQKKFKRAKRHNGTKERRWRFQPGATKGSN